MNISDCKKELVKEFGKPLLIKDIDGAKYVHADFLNFVITKKMNEDVEATERIDKLNGIITGLHEEVNKIRGGGSDELVDSTIPFEATVEKTKAAFPGAKEVNKPDEGLFDNDYQRRA